MTAGLGESLRVGREGWGRGLGCDLSMAGGDTLRFVSFRGGCRHDRDRGGIEKEVGNVLGVEVDWPEMKFNVVFDDEFSSSAIQRLHANIIMRIVYNGHAYDMPKNNWPLCCCDVRLFRDDLQM